MSEGRTRNATIVADDETDLLIINTQLFDRSLKAKQEQEYEERRHFIEGSSLFRSWNPKFKKLLEMSLRKDFYPFGAQIVRQGNPVQGLHFILSGQARVTVEPALHKQQYPRIFDPPNTFLTKDIAKKTIKKESKSRDSLQNEHVRIRRKHGYAAAEKRLAKKTVTVSCFESNEIVGDLEIILGLETYTNSVTCTTSSEVLLLDVKNLERLVYKKNMGTMNALTRNVREKLIARKTSPFVGNQVELYQLLHEKLITQQIPQHEAAHIEPTKSEQIKANSDKDKEKEQATAQLMKLFLMDRSPLIPHAIPGSLYYVCRSIQKAQQSKRRADESNLSANVRLERARKYSKRKPLSRRELERMCAGEPVDYVKQYSQKKDHAIGRILNMTSIGQEGNQGVQSKGKQRPKTAIGMSNRQVENTSINEPKLAQPVRVDIEHDIGGMLDFTELPEDIDGQTFSADDVDHEVLKRVMSDMGGYQQMKQNTRAKIICSMLEKQAGDSPTRNLLRPKSAPVPESQDVYVDGDEEELDICDGRTVNENHFDWDTSEPALKSLESKIKSFLVKYEKSSEYTPVVKTEQNEPLLIQRASSAKVPELKRFIVEGPDDIPIPGGTVYVRQKTCKFAYGVSSHSHQHVRRYMIPKNAYTIATKSLAEINRVTSTPRSPTAKPNAPTNQRPKSVPARKIGFANQASAWE